MLVININEPFKSALSLCDFASQTDSLFTRPHLKFTSPLEILQDFAFQTGVILDIYIEIIDDLPGNIEI